MDAPLRHSEFWDSVLLPSPRTRSSEDLSDLDSTLFEDSTDIGDNPDMPYNITPIAPRAEPTGSTQLPLSRVKKIVALDQDINMCSNNASFVITLATEMFIQYLAEQSHNVVKSERKPRRNIQYRDIANAVAHHDNLEFLGDVVPKTVKYGDVKEAKNPTSHTVNGSAKGPVVEAGQTTLDGSRKATGVINGTSNGAGGQHDGSNDEREQIKESRLPNGNASKSTPAETEEEDVEMS